MKTHFRGSSTVCSKFKIGFQRSSSRLTALHRSSMLTWRISGATPFTGTSFKTTFVRRGQSTTNSTMSCSVRSIWLWLTFSWRNRWSSMNLNYRPKTRKRFDATAKYIAILNFGGCNKFPSFQDFLHWICFWFHLIEHEPRLGISRWCYFCTF